MLWIFTDKRAIAQYMKDRRFRKWVEDSKSLLDSGIHKTAVYFDEFNYLEDIIKHRGKNND